jgi:hypothetical protein
VDFSKELTYPAMRWPRVVDMVTAFVDGQRRFAMRIVAKAANGEDVYKSIVSDAFAARSRRRIK